jgi:hypothetical protein
MKITTKTIKGWVNDTNYMCSPNVRSNHFRDNLNAFKDSLSDEWKELNIAFDTLRGKGASEVIIIKGWRWRGSWSDPTKEVVAKFYRR